LTVGGIPTVSLAILFEKAGWAFSPSTARTATLPNDPAGRLWWI
jgi:hypothetical protein